MHDTNDDCVLTRAAGGDGAFLERMRTAIEFLEAIATNRELLCGVTADERERLHRAIAQAYLPDPVARKKRVQAAARERTAARAARADAVLNETGIRALRRKPEFTTPNVFAPENWEQKEREGAREVDPQHCYICKEKFTAVHHFYDQMCPPCAEFNYRKRTELADLNGRVALLTGGRVKIGYQAGLKLLRAGARLLVTTRFPRDSAQRHAREPDFGAWGHRPANFGLGMTSATKFRKHVSNSERTSPPMTVLSVCAAVKMLPPISAVSRAIASELRAAVPSLRIPATISEIQRCPSFSFRLPARTNA